MINDVNLGSKPGELSCWRGLFSFRSGLSRSEIKLGTNPFIEVFHMRQKIQIFYHPDPPINQEKSL